MNITQLQKLATLIRYYILLCTTKAGSGHPTTSLSAADLMTVLFFKYLRFDLDNPDNPNNDRVVFSKGHASPLFYALYTAAGAISVSELETMRQFTSVLEGHPTPRFKYTEAATGSLGQGLSVGVGLALGLRALANENFDVPSVSLPSAPLRASAKKLVHPEYVEGQSEVTQNFAGSLPTTYVLLGDGEMAEGSVWEAIQIAAHYKLSNLVGILDVNRLAQSDATMYGHDVQAYAKRISAFGWNTIVIDGHDFEEIDEALSAINSKSEIRNSKQIQNSKFKIQNSNMPTMIIAKTLKGKGVSFIEDKDGWHGKALKQEEFDRAVVELGKVDFKLRGIVQKPGNRISYSVYRDKKKQGTPLYDIRIPTYALGDSVATRQAYGQALARLGEYYTNVVALDADVKNSTYSEIFKKAFPDRFYDMYIAEQNMVGAAVGLARLGYIPFASTFACFLTRAYDQIRMAALSAANIKLVGSHAGISIGEDGPSQMALEDLAMFRAVYGCVVLHPADALSTEKLVKEMILHKGMVYMRTARPATAVIYDADEEFNIGGSKVHKSKVKSQKSKLQRKTQNFLVTIIATGVTVYEALAAQKTLAEEGIGVTVIDCYSIKPIDAETIAKEVQNARAVITVEDHWIEGGLGDAVLSALTPIAKSKVKSQKSKVLEADFRMPPVYKLAVSEMPRSGKPGELLDWAGISAGGIVEKIRKIASSV